MSELRQMLSDSVSRLFADHADAAAESHHNGWLGDLWAQCQDLGLSLTLVPEEQGGISGTWEDAFAVLNPTGFHQIPLPIAENMLGAAVCAAAGVPLPEGVLTVCANSQGIITQPGSAARFSGTLRGVPWGRNCDSVLTVVECESESLVAILNRPDARIVESANLAGEPRDTLIFSGSPCVTAPCAAREARDLHSYCALARLPQVVGCLESALLRSVRYATERKQFGRAIGQFQAVQQQLALFGAEAAAVSSATRAACGAASSGDATFQIAAAKLRANQAIGPATACAHQVHGAIGFTWDHPLHHATQRLWSWRSEFGNDRYWSERLGAMVVRRGAENFWSDLTARDDGAV